MKQSIDNVMLGLFYLFINTIPDMPLYMYVEQLKGSVRRKLRGSEIVLLAWDLSAGDIFVIQ
jgi:hypothetical protein